MITGGLAAVGTGVLAAGAASAEASTGALPPGGGLGRLPGAISLVLHGVDWRRAVPVPTAGGAVPDLRTVGQFVDQAGTTIGSFRSTPLAETAGSPELHVLTLHDGVVLGLGSGPLEEAAFAVVGGTGRYLGATGGYVVRQFPEAGGAGTAEFAITLLLAEQRADAALGAAPTTSLSRS